MQVEQRQTASLSANPLQPRKTMDHGQAFKDLRASIKQWGILQPLEVTKAGVIVFGHRRWLAATALKMPTVPVVVTALEPRDQLLVMLVENLQRQELNPIEEAKAFNRLKEMGLSRKEIAEKVGLSECTVSTRIGLLKMPKEIQWLLDKGELPYSSVPIIRKALTPGAQVRVAMEIMKSPIATGVLRRSVHNKPPTRDGPSLELAARRKEDLPWAIERIHGIQSRLSPYQDMGVVCRELVTIEEEIAAIQNELTVIVEQLMDGAAGKRVKSMSEHRRRLKEVL